MVHMLNGPVSCEDYMCRDRDYDYNYHTVINFWYHAYILYATCCFSHCYQFVSN